MLTTGSIKVKQNTNDKIILRLPGAISSMAGKLYPKIATRYVASSKG
jgi:hypothetical protein